MRGKDNVGATMDSMDLEQQRRIIIQVGIKYYDLINKPQFKCMKFIYSQSFIDHFMGLLQTNKMTSSQLACYSPVT